MVYPLNEAAREDPDKLLVTDGKTSLTRSEFNVRVNRAIHTLHSLGLEEGDAMALVSLNRTEYSVLAFATSFGGISLVPVNWHLTVEEIHYILVQSSAKLVVAGPEHAELARRAAARAGGIRVVEIGAEFNALVEASLEAEPNEGVYATQIYFTSGTTGRPKATRMSQMPQGVPLREAVDRLRSVQKMAYGVPQGERRHLVTGPMYHAGPLSNSVQTILAGGLVRIMPRFDAVAALSLIAEHRITHLLLAPIMFSRFLQVPEDVRVRSDLSSLREVVHLGAPAPVPIKQKIIDWWGPILSDAYGGSEIGTISRISCAEWLKKPGSVGKPLSTFTIQIVGDNDEELPPGKIGQVFMTSLTDVDLAYVDDPEKTRLAHRKVKQFTLGDMGWLDEDGYLYLADRRVDMINSGGVNIYPAEIEAALADHPDVADVGVFGVPNEEWGQEVKAAVQLRSGVSASQTLEADLIEWLRSRIAGFKVPRSIDFHNQLPRYPNGKLHRRELREPYWHSQAMREARRAASA